MIASRPFATMATDLKTYKFNHSMCGSKSHSLFYAGMLIFLQDSGEGPQGIRYVPKCLPNTGLSNIFPVKFYEHLGMKMIRKIEQPEAKFDLYFMGYDSPKATSHGNHFSDREGLIELTHNYGTENDPDYKVATGNSEPGKGFGHTCISVDNI